LIDSGCLRALRTVICAKFFHRGDTFAANRVNAKCNACRAKISSPMRARNEMPLWQKPLFHRVFFNFSDARINSCHVLHVHPINLHFDRVIALQRVARTLRTRFVKR
jgi:hypothetical protein